MASHRKPKFWTPFTVAVAIVMFIAAVGYFFNIIAIYYGGMTTNILALRVAGVFIPPLGAVLGWF